MSENSTNPQEIPEVSTAVVTTNYRGNPYPVPVVHLQLPAGTRRVWRDENSDGLVVRDLNGRGPKGHIPVGYVAEGVVIAAPGSELTDVDIHFLGRCFAAYPGAIAPVPPQTRYPAPHGPGGSCMHCREPHGTPHAGDCRHAGKEVGERVR